MNQQKHLLSTAMATKNISIKNSKKCERKGVIQQEKTIFTYFTQLRFLRTGRPRKTMNITFISKITDIFVFYRVI